MNEEQLRTAVLAEAVTWMGTPWRHQGDVKGQAVDCAMLLRCVFINAGAVVPFDPRPYPRLWFLHHKEERLLDWVVKMGGTEVEPAKARPGDVLVYKIGLCYSHSAILLRPNLVIHAYHKNRQVIMTETFDASLARLECRAFDMFASRRTAP